LKKRRTQVERSEATRGQLIEAAVSCLSELGYLQATVGVVASRAGVSRGAVQHHFGSRADLLVAVVDDLGIALSRSKDIPPGLSIRERVSMSIDQTWQLLRSPHFKAVVQIWLAMQSDKKVFGATKAKVAHIESELDKKWLRLFADVHLPTKQITMARHVALATLRGLSLRNTYTQEASASAPEIETLKAMVTVALTQRK
jgi:AcrR family transcriptional regulator